MSTRVSDEVLAYCVKEKCPAGETLCVTLEGYGSTTFILADLARELLAARKIVEAAKVAAEHTEGRGFIIRSTAMDLPDLIAAYDAALPEAEPPVPPEQHTHVASAVVVAKTDCQTLPPDRLAEHIRFRAEQAIISIEDKLKTLGWTYDAATAGSMEAE